MVFDRRRVGMVALGLAVALAEPADVAAKLNVALKVVLKDPKIVERFASLGTAPVSEADATSAALRAHLSTKVPRWAAVSRPPV